MDVHNHMKLLQTTFPEDFESDPVVGATEEDLQAFMERTRLTLPPVIQAWFRITNGLLVGTRRLCGIRSGNQNRTGSPHYRTDVEFIYSFLPEFLESGWLPIGSDGCCSHYIVPLREDFGPGFPAVFHDHAGLYEPTYIVASDLEQFVKFLIKDKVMNAALPFGESNYPAWDRIAAVQTTSIRSNHTVLNQEAQDGLFCQRHRPPINRDR